MLEVIKTRDNKKVIEAMIEARSVSVWSVLRHEQEKLNFDDYALEIDEWGARIKTHIFMDTMLDIDDDFAQKANEVLYSLETDDSQSAIEKLIEMGYDIDEDGYLCGQGYTYNDPDYCHLDRDITYNIFEHDGDSYAFISVHYGADARVGFGAMVCFRINDIDYFYHGMTYDMYDRENDDSYEVFDDGVEYDEERKIWIASESGNELEFYTSADGF